MHRVDLSSFHHKKSALVLSGGVVKAAAWHLGVALGLEDLGFCLKHNSSASSELEISTYVGSSAGALVNLYFASGIRPMEVIESSISGGGGRGFKAVGYKDMLWPQNSFKKLSKNKDYRPFKEFPTFLKLLLEPILKFSGPFSTEGLKRYVEKNVLISKNFEDYSADLFIVASQLDDSRKVIFSKYLYPSPPHDSTAVYYTGVKVSEAVAASMSVPPFYAPFPVENPLTSQSDYYIDGEIRETLSTHVAIDNKCELIISSWTHTPYHYHKEIGSLVNYGLPAICTQAIFLMVQKKIITSRTARRTSQDILNTVNDYMKTNKFSNEHRLKLVEILERKLNFNPNIQLMDIYPSHQDYKIFFKNSFSLNPKKNAEIISVAYKRTIQVFRDYSMGKEL